MSTVAANPEMMRARRLAGGAPHASDAYDVLLEDGALWRIVSEGGRWYVRGTYD